MDAFQLPPLSPPNAAADGLDRIDTPGAVPPEALVGVRVRMATMGCRVNRYDTAQLRGELVAMGCTLVDDAPYDIYLLNTCTVTHAADAEARRLARRARRTCPEAKVVLTGCYAEVDPDTLNDMDAVDLVVGNQGKDYLAKHIATLAAGPSTQSVQGAGSGADAPLPVIDERYGSQDRRSLTSPVSTASPRTDLPTAGVPSAGVGEASHSPQDRRGLTSPVSTASPRTDLPTAGLPTAGLLTAGVDQGGATRFFLKVQEGCDVRCAFCIIPRARGEARSMPLEPVLARLNLAYEAGHREAVLAGIHLGGYGEEIGTNLAGLVRRVLAETDLPRIRFGSLEPWGLSDEFVELFASEPRLLPSLHLPLQAGSASVLKRMRRPCTPDFYRRQVGRIMAAKPALYLSTDVLTGFPGETDAEFDEGFEFIQSMPFAHLHVFPYSARQGTPAATMESMVVERVKKQRVGRLIALSDAKQQVALADQVGRRSEVLIEADGKGHSHNNFMVQVVADPLPKPGSRVMVEITEVVDNHLLGRQVPV